MMVQNKELRGTRYFSQLKEGPATHAQIVLNV
jgi:hypothetical protein